MTGILDLNNNNLVSASKILIGTGTPATNSFVICGNSNSNGTDNSIVVGDSTTVNIRRANGASTCDLGSSGGPFQSIHLTGDVRGLTNNRSVDDIVSNAGTSILGNIPTFSSNTGKVIADSTVALRLIFLWLGAV